MTYQGIVQNGVVVLDNGNELPDGTLVEVIVRQPIVTKSPLTRTSLADWAEQNAEHWGSELSSENVEGFTGRRF